ncbi:hypothetical protein [Prescottella equi]|uniref:hypothetical protein n=1 Tax=Rhodococcus hoagii TaxID=43767 RepID=UPI001C780317|nr:hypothetical protein [Prescottella equi]BCN51598.1 hypothetical protein RE9416_48990 [Prescottella equi]BCN56619.1 hypothetical protein RE9425_50090 [Prescottella equi]BCN61533.1 hypothetical protein RE9427_49030 [Prescottella equi]BCN86336.1 hypothetical protein RE0356_49770 [Prescottella equi]
MSVTDTIADTARAHPAAAIVLAIAVALAIIVGTALGAYAVLTPNPESFHRITELFHGPTMTNASDT